MSAEIEGVLSHEAFGQLRVAGFERFDDGHVIDDRAARAILLGNGAHPNGAHVKEQVFGDLEEQIALAQPEQRLVEGNVGLGVLVDPGLGGAVRVERREHRPQGGDLLVGGILDDQPCRHALQRRPHRDHLEHFLPGLAGDEGAAARNVADEAFVLEPAKRLPDRCTAHPQLDREFPLVQAVLFFVGVDIDRGDGGLELLVDAVLEHDGTVDPLQGQVGYNHGDNCSKRSSVSGMQNTNYWIGSPERTPSRVMPARPTTP